VQKALISSKVLLVGTEAKVSRRIATANYFQRHISICCLVRSLTENFSQFRYTWKGGSTSVGTLRPRTCFLQNFKRKVRCFLLKTEGRQNSELFTIKKILCQFHLQRLHVDCLHPAFEDGTDAGFRNVGQLQFDDGEIPKRTYTIFKSRRKLKSRTRRSRFFNCSFYLHCEKKIPFRCCETRPPYSMVIRDILRHTYNTLALG